MGVGNRQGGTREAQSNHLQTEFPIRLRSSRAVAGAVGRWKARYGKTKDDGSRVGGSQAGCSLRRDGGRGAHLAILETNTTSAIAKRREDEIRQLKR